MSWFVFMAGWITGVGTCFIFATLNYIEQVNLANPRFRHDIDRTGTPAIIAVWCVGIVVSFILFPLMLLQAVLHGTFFMFRSRVKKLLGGDPHADVSP